jgi:hypothetical protein
MQSMSSIWNNSTYSNLVWNNDANQTSSSGFWEEPTKPTPMPASGNAAKNNPQKLSKSQTMGNIVTNKTAAAIVAATSVSPAKPQKGNQQQQQQPPQKTKSASNLPGGQQQQQQQSFAAAAAAASANQLNNIKPKSNNNDGNHKNKNSGDKNFNEFSDWCMRTLSAMENIINIVDGE